MADVGRLRVVACLLLGALGTAAACREDRPARDDDGDDGETDSTAYDACRRAACGTPVRDAIDRTDDASGVAAVLDQRAQLAGNACFALAGTTTEDWREGESESDFVGRVCDAGVTRFLAELEAAGGGASYGAPRCAVPLDVLAACADACTCETCVEPPFVPVDEPIFAMCPGRCTGACLPHAGAETVVCTGVCSGRCSGLCDGVDVTGAACDGACDGLCDGPCEQDVVIPCDGYCDGACASAASDVHQLAVPVGGVCSACAARCASVVGATSVVCTRVGVAVPGVPPDRERLARDYLQACAELLALEPTQFLASLPTEPIVLDEGATPTEQACVEAVAHVERRLIERRAYIAAACAGAPRLIEALER